MTHQNSEKTVQQHEEFSQLFREHSRWLFNYLLSLLRNSADVEDVLQETGRVCWQKFGQHEPIRDFRAWAGKIAYFEAMKFFDRCKKQDVLCSEPFLEAIAGQAITMADQLDRRSEALKSCLQRLPEKDRILIDQRYTFNASVQELAEGSGRSVYAIYRALKRIHDMLQRCINRLVAES